MNKKFLIFGLAIASTFALASCNDSNNNSNIDNTNTNTNDTTEEEIKQDVSIIVPAGTPALGLANYKVAHSEAKFDITNGSDELIAAFGTKSHDVVVAPVNLGAKFFNTNGNYVLAKTFVWGNLFLASKSDLTSFDDIDGKKLVVFGKNSTPDIITKILIQEKGLNVEIEYVDAVADANPLLVSGKADYIITAEPAISKIKDANGIKTIDLQEEYAKLTNTNSYPQAGIFVKKEDKDDKKIKAVVDALVESVNETKNNPEKSAENAVSIHKSFETLGKAALVKAIPNCHFNILNKEDEKKAVEKYLQYLLDLGFGKQVGDKLPSEEFYL